MAPKKIQTVLRFPNQTVSFAEDAAPPVLPNSQLARKSEKMEVDSLHSQLHTLNSLLDKGFSEVAPLVGETVRKLIARTGKKRPRDDSSSCKPPATRTAHTFHEKAYHLRGAAGFADAAAYCREKKLPESLLSDWIRNSKLIHKMILCGQGHQKRFRPPRKYQALFEELFAKMQSEPP